jgi:hypothetical protein
MISGTVTKNFGLLATDSAQYDTSQSLMSFEQLKLLRLPRYVLCYIGTPVYLAKIDKEKLGGDMQLISVYLEDYLKKKNPEVEKILKSEIADPDENKPHFCMLVLGLHKKLPTIVQFNSTNNFKPKYLFSNDEKPKFSTLMYGDDDPKRKHAFTESTEYMEKKTAKWLKKGIVFSPGIGAEILTRGIYKQADLDAEIGLKQKFAGGAVNVAGILNTGLIISLSGLIPA